MFQLIVENTGKDSENSRYARQLQSSNIIKYRKCGLSVVFGGSTTIRGPASIMALDIQI